VFLGNTFCFKASKVAVLYVGDKATESLLLRQVVEQYSDKDTALWTMKGKRIIEEGSGPASHSSGRLMSTPAVKCAGSEVDPRKGAKDSAVHVKLYPQRKHSEFQKCLPVVCQKVSKEWTGHDSEEQKFKLVVVSNLIEAV
jgi:hypothetical protein